MRPGLILLSLALPLTLTVACTDDPFFSNPDRGLGGGDFTGVEASVTDRGASNLPDGYQLYKCTNIGQACNAHDSCAINPICGPDGLCRPTLLQDCNDKLPCTTDKCLGSGVCENTPKSGQCKLAVRVPKGVTCAQARGGGAQLDAGVANDAGVTPGQKETIFCCFNSGDRNPVDNCSVCSPPTGGDMGFGAGSATAWSSANGGYCNDGNPCTQNDYCKNGTCQGTSYASKCSDGISCTQDICDGNGGCSPNHPLKSGYCLINNACYKDGAAHPSGQCLACVSNKNPADWTAVSNTCTIDGKCYVKGAKNPGGCAICDPALSLTQWSVTGNTHCLVNNKCIASGAKDSTGCASCQPSTNRYAYTALPGMCTIDSTCYATGNKHPQGCAECDSSVSTSKWTVKVSTHCLINNQCVTSGSKDPTPGSCSSCQPAVNKYDYSADAGYCKIDGKCVTSGTQHPQGCATCNPVKNKAKWSPKTAQDCVLNGNCQKMCGATCADKLSNPNHCGACFNACSSGLFCVAGKCGTAAPDCKTIKAGNAAAKDGVYTMFTPGGTGTWKAYCDMTSDGGGWTLAARFSNADGTGWIDTGAYWYTRTTELGTPTSRTDNKDALSQAFWKVKGLEFKLSRTDRPTDEALLRTTGSCLGSKTFRDKIKSMGNYLTGIWASDAVRGTCSAVFKNYSGTSGFKYATCTGTIGKANSVSFFADYSSGDGAVLMIGGGGSACGRADHGIAVTEENAAKFGTSLTRKDFGEDSPTGSSVYSLNLFVR